MIKGKDYIWVWCWAFILNDENELLLMKRSSECRNKAWFWSIPWGWVRLFDTLEDSLVRECKEEIWVEIEILKLLSVTDDIILEEKQHWVSPQFLCKIVSGEVTNLEPHKCEEIKYFPLDELPEKLTNTTIDWVRSLKEMIKK